MADASNPAETDSWLHHVIVKAEVCPNRGNTCGIWHYAITRSIKTSGKIEISGRMLSLINNGIERAAEATAAKCRDARFRGVVYETVSSIHRGIGDTYRIILDPTDDDEAHAFLEHVAYNNDSAAVEALLISAEISRLHQSFIFAAPGSKDLGLLEARAGTAA